MLPTRTVSVAFARRWLTARSWARDLHQMLGLTGAQAGPWRQDADRVYNFVAAWRSAGAVAKLHSMKDHLEAVCRKFFWHGERLPRLLPAHPYPPAGLHEARARRV